MATTIDSTSTHAHVLHGLSDRDRLGRALARVFETLRIPSKRVQRGGFPRGMWRWGIGLAGALAVTLSIAAAPVSAALHKVFQFIPGIGFVQPMHPGQPVAVLFHPLQGTWFGQPIRVTGMMVTPSEVLVVMTGSDSAAPSRVSFQTAAGKTIQLTGGGATATGTGGTQWAWDYYAAGQFGTAPQDVAGTLVIADGGAVDGRIPVRLNLVKSAEAMARLGPTQTHQGVTLTAIASRTGSTETLTLIPQAPGPFRPSNPTPDFANPDHPGLEVTDAAGHPYPTKQVFNVGMSTEFTFVPNPKVTQYAVTVPKIEVTYPGQATTRLPVPARGSEPMDKTLNLGGFPVTITQVERISSANLRIDVNLHATPSEPKELHGFRIRTTADTWQSHSSPDGILQWIQVPVAPKQQALTLRLSQPAVYLRGPWTFPISVRAPSSLPGTSN